MQRDYGLVTKLSRSNSDIYGSFSNLLFLLGTTKKASDIFKVF